MHTPIRFQPIALALIAALAFTHAPTATTAGPNTPILQKHPGPRTALIEDYARYDGQTKCSRGAKPGVRAFERILLQRFKGTYSTGIKRSCAGPSVSEHKEGRAIDWGVNAKRSADRRKAKKAIRWLLKSDRFGNEHAIARRLGVMYIIWNKRMWRAYRPDAGWLPYEGSNPHTDHMHISFSRAGGRGLTSFWTGKVYPPVVLPPPPPPTPTPTPTPKPTPTPTPSPTVTSSP